MSKMNVSRRGPVASSKNVTLRHLSPGETFRFPRSKPGTVYQMLSVSERAREEGGLELGELKFVYANITTGQIFGDASNHTVLPVDCSLVWRDRNAQRVAQRSTKATPRKVTSSRSRTQTRTQTRTRRRPAR